MIEDYVATNKRDKIRRSKIENDIIRLTHENEDLPLSYKLSCTSLILHTDTFESFWIDQKLAHGLSDKALGRMNPEYRLLDEIPSPQDSSTLAKLTIAKPGSARRQTTKSKNTKKSRPKITARPTNRKSSSRDNECKSEVTLQFQRKVSRKKAYTPLTGVRTTRTQAARGTRSKSGASTVNKVSASNAVSTKEPSKMDMTVETSIPRGQRTARETYLELMERTRDEPVPRGPSSSDESDDSD